MYHLLITPVPSNEIQHGEPLAVDDTLCRTLAAQRDSPRSIESLPFLIGSACLGVDYLYIGNVAMGKLCSQHFIEVLAEMDVPFTAYSTHLLEKDTKQSLTAFYFFWIPQWVEGAIDWENSEEWVNFETGTRHLTKLVLTHTTTTNAPLLFQTKERAYILIHDTLRTRLEAARITGIAFAPLDAVYIPHVGLERLDLERFLQEHPEDWTGWQQLSNKQVMLHRYEDALNTLSKVLALKPDAAEAWHRRGQVFQTLGHLQEALEALEQAIKLNPQSPAWNEYCEVLREMGRKEEAWMSAEQLVSLQSRPYLSWYELAAAHATLERYDEALRAIESGLSLVVGSGGGLRLVKMYRLKGEVLLHLRRNEEALTTFEIGLRSMPRDIVLWKGKVKALHALDHKEEAMVAEQELHRLEQRREENLKKRP